MSFETILMHPPLDDPTMPYHASAYLAGHLRHRGVGHVAIRDINIEFINYCLEESSLDAFYAEADQRIDAFEESDRLDYPEQQQCHRLAIAPRHAYARLAEDVAVLRTYEKFLNYGDYADAVARINDYFGLLGALSYPAEINNFTLRGQGRYSTHSFKDLFSVNLAEKVCNPFIRYFEDRLRDDADFQRADLLGISVVYEHQLMYAIQLARMIKRAWPEKKVIFGGTTVSQLYKYLEDKQKIRRFFDICDAIVIGEGESALCEIVAAKADFSSVPHITNTITYDRTSGQLHLPPIKYENVSALGSPVYDYPWDLYLSPERGINYSPTRGCYWNRCTFCDYGLNFDKPTSPWRERAVERVITDLTVVQRKYDVRYFYLAVDVMAPSYMSRLADAIVGSELKMSWSSEIRLEKAFKPDRAQKIALSGAVCLSFGMESGNQRILDLIDKGTKLEYMSEAMRNFASAGVAVQLMAFTGFPTETRAEAEQTRQFVRDNEAYWSTGGLGTFLLTGKSIVARNPENFGIEIVDTEGADVARAITYRMRGEDRNRSNLSEIADDSFDEVDTIFPTVLGRPWAGGVDTLHSMIYYKKFGRNYFKENPLDRDGRTGSGIAANRLCCTIVLGGPLIKSGIDMAQIMRNHHAYQAYLEQCLDVPAVPTYAGFLEWSRVATQVENGRKACWLLTRDVAVKLSEPVYRVLKVAITKSLPLGELLAGFSVVARERLIGYFHELEAQGVLTFVQPGHGRQDACEVEIGVEMS